MTKALPPSPESDEEESEAEFTEFGDRWERANELRSIVTRLPSQVVLKSGLSARRNHLLERWNELDTPNLDGTLPDGALEGLNKWIHESEILISYIVNIGREAQNPKPSDGRVHSGPAVDEEELPQVIATINEVDWISDSWCWPWPEKSLSMAIRKKWDKGKLIKFGAVGALGLMAIVTYLDED